MMQRESVRSGRFWLADQVTEWMVLMAGILLLGLILLMGTNVVLRYGFANGLTGFLEVLQVGMTFVVFFSLPYCTRIGAHIVVDVLSSLIPASVWRVTAPFVEIIGAIMFALLAWQCAIRAMEAVEYHDTTNILQISQGYPWGIIAVGSAVTAIIFVLRISFAPRTASAVELSQE